MCRLQHCCFSYHSFQTCSTTQPRSPALYLCALYCARCRTLPHCACHRHGLSAAAHVKARTAGFQAHAMLAASEPTGTSTTQLLGITALSAVTSLRLDLDVGESEVG